MSRQLTDKIELGDDEALGGADDAGEVGRIEAPPRMRKGDIEAVGVPGVATAEEIKEANALAVALDKQL